MPGTIFVAGASGTLGRHVTQLLQARGDRVHALTRSKRFDLADVVHRGDALIDDLAKLLVGVDVVFSCLGNSARLEWRGSRAAYTAVDTPANTRLITAAKEAGVRRFVYVSVIKARELSHLDYMGAHASVETALQDSGLPHAVIRPTGFFSVFDDFLTFARLGAVPVIGDGHPRSNPIHEADLAEACIEAIDGGPAERDIGGPDILTRREIAGLACQAAGRRRRIVLIPPALARLGGTLLRPLNPRLGHLVHFASAIFTQDAIAPPTGSRHLGDYFVQRAVRRP